MKTILIVDDSRATRMFVRNALARIGFDVAEAGDGALALATLSANPEICGVLCDQNMPGMSGLDFLRLIPPELPVIVLSAEGSPSLMQDAKARGARGWIVKPTSAETLCATVTSVIGLPDVPAAPASQQ